MHRIFSCYFTRIPENIRKRGPNYRHCCLNVIELLKIIFQACTSHTMNTHTTTITYRLYSVKQSGGLRRKSIAKQRGKVITKLKIMRKKRAG